MEIPESITAESLDPAARRHLNSLNPENADRVARHLAYAGEMIDIDPEVAYEHAKAAYSRAARIDVVREALGLTSYITGRYSESLRELRTYRRMSDDYSHVPLEADSERGLGRPEKALRFIEGIPLNRLDPAAQVELAFVTSGAKAETGDSEGGFAVVEKLKINNLPEEVAARAQLIKADRLSELGRDDEADALRREWQPKLSDDDSDMMFDLDDVLDDIEDEPENAYVDDTYGDDASADGEPNGDAADEPRTVGEADEFDDDEFADDLDTDDAESDDFLDDETEEPASESTAQSDDESTR